LQSEVEALILQFGSAMTNKNTTVLENIVASEITLGNDLAPDEAPTISRSQFIADLTGMETLLRSSPILSVELGLTLKP